MHHCFQYPHQNTQLAIHIRAEDMFSKKSIQFVNAYIVSTSSVSVVSSFSVFWKSSSLMAASIEAGLHSCAFSVSTCFNCLLASAIYHTNFRDHNDTIISIILLFWHLVGAAYETSLVQASLDPTGCYVCE